MAQAMKFNVGGLDRDRVFLAAEAVALAMPPNSAIEDAVQEARRQGNPLLDKLEVLLGSLWAAHGQATDAVAWPGSLCVLASPAAFATA